MPIVPRSENASVMPSAGGGGAFDNPLTLAAATLSGRQTSELGDAMSPAAHAAEVFARAAKDKAEATVALDATNRLQGVKFDLSNPDTGYKSLLGGDAVKGIDGWAMTDHYLSVFDKGWKDISSKLMPGPQAMFDSSAANMRKDFARDLIAHEAEQGRAWHQQVLNQAVRNATGALIAGTNGDDAVHVAKARAALTADGLGQGLSGEVLDKQTNLAFGLRVVEPVVTARLSQGDVAGAKTFFDAHRAGMAVDDADLLDKRLAEAGRAADTAATVDDLWNRFGPKSLNDPIDWHAIENDLVNRYGGDDQALMRARDEVFHRLFGFTQARDETHAGYVNLAINRIKDGASPSQIASLPQFLALPEDKQQEITNWQRDRLAEKLNGFVPDQNLDRMARQFAAYHDLSDHDAIKQMSDARISALEPVLGEDLTKQALAQKTGMPLDKSDFSAVVRSIGLDSAPSHILARAQLGVVRSMANAAIASAGKVLTPQQRRDVALDVAETAIQGHPLFAEPGVEAVPAAAPNGGRQKDWDGALGRKSYGPTTQVAAGYGPLGLDIGRLFGAKTDAGIVTDTMAWNPMMPHPNAVEQEALQIVADRAKDPSIAFDPKLGTLVHIDSNPDGITTRTAFTAEQLQTLTESVLHTKSYVSAQKSPEQIDLEDQVAKSKPASDQAPKTGVGPHHYSLQPDDQLLLARMIYAETSNIPEDAAAIGWTMVNRVGDREFGATLTDVLRQRNGYQIVPEGGGPAGGSAQWRATENPGKLTGANAASWEAAQRAAAGIIDGSIPDPTGGATFFFSADGFDGNYKNAPGGFRTMLRKATIQPSIYQSQSTRSRSNYFFTEKKNK